MNFNIFWEKKEKLFETVEYFGLFLSETDTDTDTDTIVKFEPLLDLVKEFELAIVKMAYYSSNPLDDRRMIVFGLKGTLQNLTLFGLRAEQIPRLSQFLEGLDT